ncbi:hypothetical protein ACI65C_006156 [Semiaphis heraclei]
MSNEDCLSKKHQRRLIKNEVDYLINPIRNVACTSQTIRHNMSLDQSAVSENQIATSYINDSFLNSFTAHAVLDISTDPIVDTTFSAELTNNDFTKALSNDFIKAKEILSKAEYRSDFESDSSAALKMRKVYAAKSISDSDEFDENSDPISNNIPPFPNPPAKKIIYTSTQKHSGKKRMFNSSSTSIQKPVYEKQVCSPVVSSQKCLFNSESMAASTPEQSTQKHSGKKHLFNSGSTSIQKPVYEKQVCSPVVSSQKCLFNSESMTVSTPSQKIKKYLGTFNNSISPLPSTSSDSRYKNLELNDPQLSSLSPNLFEDIDLDINQLPFEIEPGSENNDNPSDLISVAEVDLQNNFNNGPFNSHETQIWLIKSIAQLKIDQLLKQLLFDNHPENDLELDKLILKFPIGNETSLFEIEEKLTTDNIANKYLVKKMSKLISSDYKQSIFSLMRFLLTNELATKMTFFGKTSKLVFASLKLYAILEKVMLKSNPEITIKKIQEPIQSWLRHANEDLQKKINKML